MSNTVEFGALEKLVRPLSRKLSEELARALVSVEPDEEAQNRFELLAEKNTEGTLSAEERDELEALVRANTFLQILKLEARVALAGSAAA
jgi:hypothetical protein